MTEAKVDDWNGALRVRFDDPDKRNTLGLDTVDQLYGLLVDNPDRTLVLGSTSSGSFSAGADLQAPDDVRAKISDRLYEIYGLMVQRAGVVVAVVEGAAVGGGSQLVSAADLRVVGPGARLKWVGAGHGLVVGAWVLPSVIGRSQALRLALTSDWVSADAAVQLGLAGQVDAEPWAVAEQLVAHLATLDATAVAKFKQVSGAPEIGARLDEERRVNAAWSGNVPKAL